VQVFVARQAIFHPDRRVFGYELLSRSRGDCNQFDGSDSSAATALLLANSLLAIGLEQLVGDKKAFVNFGRELLLDEWPAALPPETTVIEVLESVSADTDVIAACRRLKRQGYRIALDDFVLRSDTEALLGVADFVKLEIHSYSPAEQCDLVRQWRARGLQVIAEKVETQAEFAAAQEAGYHYYQGYFFARPVMIQSQHIPTPKMHCLRMLQEARRAELDRERLEELIQADVAFSYKLLRYVNSARMAHRATIRSIRQALLFLGDENIRRWIVLAVLPRLASDKPGELVQHSLVRARLCELGAGLADTGLAQEAFLMGLFSLLDALIDQPLDEALAAINLAPEISSVLVGAAPQEHPLTKVYQLARAYERADWDRVDSLSDGLGIPQAGLGDAYCEALRWSGEVMSSS
jgi:c-di-GMP-related signal transduction protein